METTFNTSLVANYRADSQIARILTESWMLDYMYCPRCGHHEIKHFPNNRPVADFYCPRCKNEYELKSKNGPLGHKITDGAYHTMIQRITSNQNPDFFFMSYSKDQLSIRDLILIPKHFFVPEIIEKRKPLKENARRAGWIGCNILLDKIPDQGKIPIISNGILLDKNAILDTLNKSIALEQNDISSRGWLMDILNCVNQMPTQIFSLENIYCFENYLHARHPENAHIKHKIRQQLQILRDKGFIDFLGHGNYKKI